MEFITEAVLELRWAPLGALLPQERKHKRGGEKREEERKEEKRQFDKIKWHGSARIEVCTSRCFATTRERR